MAFKSSKMQSMCIVLVFVKPSSVDSNISWVKADRSNEAAQSICCIIASIVHINDHKSSWESDVVWDVKHFDVWCNNKQLWCTYMHAHTQTYTVHTETLTSADVTCSKSIIILPIGEDHVENPLAYILSVHQQHRNI